MATKRKRRVKSKSRIDLFAQAKRQFAKGNYRDALKGAKACYRQEPTSEGRHLLEHALMARAQQLCEARLRDEARAVLQYLLDLGVTEPAAEAALPDLLVTAGLWDRVAGGGGAAGETVDPKVAAAIADQAVLHPNDTQTVPADIRSGAAAIRESLDTLYAGDEVAAYQSLKTIPRTSPLADWKLFVRGLAAYYRGNRDEMRANWERLDPNRRAQRIAAPLTDLANLDNSGEDADRLGEVAGQIERLVRDRPVLATLNALRVELDEERWEAAARTFATARQRLREFDQRLTDNIAEIFYWEFVAEGNFDLLDRIASCVTPLAMDPHWNRARALDAEVADEEVWEQDRHWRRYLEDLAELTALAPEERLLAQALVWERIAARFVDEESRHTRFCRRPDCDESARHRTQAIESFERGMELAPQIASIAEALADAQIEWDQVEDAAATYRQLVERVPDDFSALFFLATHDLRNGRPLEAQRYAQRACQVKPRDGQIRALVVTLHAAAAAHYAEEKEVDRGRAELAAAEQFEPALTGTFHFLAHRAVLEYAAGDAKLGAELATQSQQALAEPTAALLALAIESIRYGLAPDPHDAYFEHAWHKALKKRCQSATAGTMAQLLTDYLSIQTAYPRSGDHIVAVRGYIKRCSRIRWQLGDLRHACKFLAENVSLSDPVLKKLVRKATKQFPDAPVFFLLEGQIEMDKGPRQCNWESARRAHQRALDLVADSSDPEDVMFAAAARKALALLGETDSLLPPPLHSDMDMDGDMDLDLDMDAKAEAEAEADLKRILGMPLEEAAKKLQEFCATEGVSGEMAAEMLAQIFAEAQAEAGKQ
jgi:tetratricopeptide (TPR) repeat protein